MGLALSLQNVRSSATRKGTKWAHAKTGNHRRVLKPRTRTLIRSREDNIGEWGVGGEDSVYRLDLVVLAVDDGVGNCSPGGGGGHQVAASGGGNMHIFEKGVQLRPAECGRHGRSTLKQMEGDQGIEGAVMAKTRGARGGG